MINRQNYEEFFLMYADNELTAQQRTAVELFLKQNPDLVPELDMFMQIKLEPEEEVTFTGKEALYKTTGAEISTTNYEEFFLLYVDRELSSAGSGKVEKFVLQHPQLQDEFTLLKQTVLQPEAITFADKSSLYRQEERRRVVPLFSFMRVAVAAAIIGAMVLGWWLYPQQQGTLPAGTSVAVKTTPKQSTATPQVTPNVAPTVTPQVQQQAVQQSTAAVNTAPKQKVQTAAPAVNNQKAVNIPAPVNNNAVNNGLLAENKQDKPKENAVITTPPVDSDALASNNNQAGLKPATKPVVIDVDIIREQEKANNNSAVAQNDNVYPVAYKVIDTDEDNKAMYVGSLELNKDKVKGFLKRVFGNKTKRDTEN